MKKRLLSFFFSFILVFSLIPVSVFAAGTTARGFCGRNARWELSGKTLIISGTGDMTDYSAYGAPWADYISSGNSSGGLVTSIVIQDGITSIGDYAFYGSAYVTSVTIASSVQEIGKHAFEVCDLLERVSIPSSVTVIDDYAFGCCYKLKEMTLPSSLETLGIGAFWNCSSLTQVHIPASVQTFGEEKFTYNSSVFSGCTGIKAFSADPGNPILTVQDGVLFNKDMTRLIHYPLGSFSAEYTVPDGVRTISHEAFGKCRYLKTVMLPDTVEEIQEYAFYYSPNLEKLTFSGDAPAFCGSGIFYDNRITAHYPIHNSTWEEDILQNYGGTVTWTPSGPNGEPAGTHGDTVTWMFDGSTGTLHIFGNGAIKKEFSGSMMPWYSLHDQITSIVVEPGITEIPSYAFEYLESVTTISLPDTLKTLALNAFNDCQSLNNLIIPASVQTINGSSNTGYPAFIRCGSLTDVYYMGTEAAWLAIPKAEHVVNSYADMTIHFLQLHENPATCTQSGTQSYYTFDDTSVYGDLYDLQMHVITELEELPALGHSCGEGIVVTPPTCTATGVKSFTCDTCGDSYTEEIEAAGHTETALPAVAPTCTKNGLTQGSHCCVCGEALVPQEEVAPLGHSYDDGVVTTAPACTKAGVKTFSCAVCGDSYTEAVESIGHTEEQIPAITPTCTEPGMTAGKRCSVCCEILVMQTALPALEHNFESGFCTQCGSQDPSYIPGDINGDGKVNNKDATRLFQYLSGWNVEVKEAFLDVNGDGRVNNKDATRLFQYLSGWNVEIY